MSSNSAASSLSKQSKTQPARSSNCVKSPTFLFFVCDDKISSANSWPPASIAIALKRSTRDFEPILVILKQSDPRRTRSRNTSFSEKCRSTTFTGDSHSEISQAMPTPGTQDGRKVEARNCALLTMKCQDSDPLGSRTMFAGSSTSPSRRRGQAKTAHRRQHTQINILSPSSLNAIPGCSSMHNRASST